MQQLRNALVRHAEDLTSLPNRKPCSSHERTSRVGRRGRGLELQLIGLLTSRLGVDHVSSEGTRKYHLELDRDVPHGDA